MTPHRLLNLALVAAICAVMSTAYLLDGPSDIDAARDTAASVADAQAAARAAAKHAHTSSHWAPKATRAQTVTTAQVQP